MYVYLYLDCELILELVAKQIYHVKQINSNFKQSMLMKSIGLKYNVFFIFRFLFDVTFLFKALNGYMDVDFSQFLDFYCQEDRYSFRHFDNRSLKKRFARTNVLKNSFFHRIVDKWNILLYEIRSASNVYIFKSKVMKFLLQCK